MLQLINVVTDDNRFAVVQNYVERIGSNMCEVLNAIENRGIEKVIEQRRLKTTVNTLPRYVHHSLPITSQVLEDIAGDNELTVEKVRSIAKENGISLSC